MIFIINYALLAMKRNGEISQIKKFNANKKSDYMNSKLIMQVIKA